MKLAILETGRPPGDLADWFGDYPAMFERLLGDGFEVETFDVQEEALEAVTSSAPDREQAKFFLEQAIQMTPRPEIKARARAIITKLTGDRQEVK